jgi:hypothetical protein
MSGARFEPVTAVFQRRKTLSALDSAVTAIDEAFRYHRRIRTVTVECQKVI